MQESLSVSFIQHNLRGIWRNKRQSKPEEAVAPELSGQGIELLRRR
ncbi:hypothetical protein FHR87_000522 [Azomonas macrocytogenes]|uniref:Uncharacterized protein n=1 Tax=Azomonas macrocytogenes TaxID=69962 RepID=A0A839SZM1_AZOMA|nr:hypothetical protein [Azomonas macrocytogenes]